MSYYLVLCKCGHVGKNMYMPIWFPIEANSGKEAAAIARMMPRCKHDHKDAILNCVKVDYEEFEYQRNINNNDPYLLCKSKYEQKMIFSLIKHRLVYDKHCEGGEKSKYKKRKVNLLLQTRKQRDCYNENEY